MIVVAQQVLEDMNRKYAELTKASNGKYTVDTVALAGICIGIQNLKKQWNDEKNDGITLEAIKQVIQKQLKREGMLGKISPQLHQFLVNYIEQIPNLPKDMKLKVLKK